MREYLRRLRGPSRGTWRDTEARQAARRRRVAMGMAVRVLDELAGAGVEVDVFLLELRDERGRRG